jgi:hypothetical protein
MEKYVKEIRDLHQYFQDYLLGNIDAESMDYFDRVIDTSFTIVTDDGGILDFDGIKDYVRNMYGQRSHFRIWTENVTLKQHIGNVMVVTYEEWQTIDDTSTVRVSTGIFREDADAPNGLVWLHVHESGYRTVENKI